VEAGGDALGRERVDARERRINVVAEQEDDVGRLLVDTRDDTPQPPLAHVRAAGEEVGDDRHAEAVQRAWPPRLVEGRAPDHDAPGLDEARPRQHGGEEQRCHRTEAANPIEWVRREKR
jgi:hypothetical protein